MYSLLINVLAGQLLPFSFRICINLFHLSCSNVCPSMKKALNFSLSKFRSDITLSIPIASLFPFPLINPNWSFQSTSSKLYSNFLLWILATLFALWTIKLIAGWSLHFVAFGFFLKSIITSMKSLGISSFIFVVDQLCHYFSQNLFPTIWAHSQASFGLLIPHLLDSLFHVTVQNIRAFLVCIYFPFIFDF